MRKGVHDYDSRIKRIYNQLERELSAENIKLIRKYDREMVNQSIAVATRQKHLKTLLYLTRFLNKNWTDVTKDYIGDLVFRIMDQHSDGSGQETNYSYDFKILPRSSSFLYTVVYNMYTGNYSKIN